MPRPTPFRGGLGTRCGPEEAAAPNRRRPTPLPLVDEFEFEFEFEFEVEVEGGADEDRGEEVLLAPPMFGVRLNSVGESVP